MSTTTNLQASQPQRYQSNKYCVCTACIDKDGLCETLVELEEHLKIVGSLVSKDTRLMHLVSVDSSNQEGDIVACPVVLLAYFSGVIGRELQRQLGHGKLLDTIKIDSDIANSDELKTLAEWCHTGLINSDGWPHFTTGCRIERLWYLAQALDMPQFANSSMRIIMAKYSWNFFGKPGAPTLDIENAPFGPEGPCHVIEKESDEARYSLLYLFMKGLMICRDGFGSDVIANVRKVHSYKKKWFSLRPNRKFWDMFLEWTDDDNVEGPRNLPMLPHDSFKFFVECTKRDTREWFSQLCQRGYRKVADQETASCALSISKDKHHGNEKAYTECDFYDPDHDCDTSSED